jgi:hypothetical protein
VISLALLITASVIWLRPGEPGASANTFASGCLRIGLLLAALWLALPQVLALFVRFPPWLIFTSLGLAILVVLNPKSLTYVIPLAGILLLLHFFGYFTRPAARRKPPGPPPTQGTG